jgi:hypothetical protein
MAAPSYPPGSVTEWEQLLRAIRRSDEFSGAPKRRAILDYLFHARDDAAGSSERGIAEHALDVEPGAAFNPTGVREQCKELRRRLDRFAESAAGQAQKWRCTLPNAVRGEGYRLRFEDRTAPRRATEAFWHAHLFGKPALETVVVLTEPLFYRDVAANVVLRFWDINRDETSRADALAALAQQHPFVLEYFREGLFPSYLYLLSGEVGARDQIADWFDAHGHPRPTTWKSRQLPGGIEGKSPILLGKPSVNRYMQTVFDAPTAQHLGMRHDQRLGCTRLAAVTPAEEAVLRRHGARVTRAGEACLLDDDPQSEVYGVVTRIPNPYRRGVVTMLSAYNTRAVEQMAAVLTDDERLRVVFEQAGLSPTDPVPESMQWLFVVPTMVATTWTRRRAARPSCSAARRPGAPWGGLMGVAPGGRPDGT